MASLLLNSESESVLFPVDAAVDGVADKEGVDDAAEADVGTAWRIPLSSTDAHEWVDAHDKS